MADIHGGIFPKFRPLEGVAGPAAELWVRDKTLGQHQEHACLLAGVRWPEVPDPTGPRLLIREDVFVTREAVAAFVALAKVAGRDASWSASGHFGAFVDELRFGRADPMMVWLEPSEGAPQTAERLVAAAPLLVDPQERPLQVPAPVGSADILELPITERMVMPVGHWLQLLWANLLAMAPFLWRQLAGRNVVEVIWRVGWAALFTLSLSPQRIGARLGRRGRGCRVHPTATVEASWLGAGVEIGAGAVVRGSILGDGASVEALAMVEGSVLAPGARVQRQGMVKYSVLGPRSAAAGDMQLGMLDREAAAKKTSVLMDMSLGQGVRVMADGEAHPAPLGIAGVCVGAGSVVGAGVRIAPGRVIPPGVTIAPPPAHVVRRIPEGLAGVVHVHDGTLVPEEP